MLRRSFMIAAGVAAAATLAAIRPRRAAASAETTAHDFAFPSIDGGVLRLKDFAGGPVLVVNTASRCGFTPQYEGLQQLWERYRARGLTVVGVPSDDFGGQELASEAEVKEFCAVTFSIDFPMTTITKVRGTDRHPFYAWAASELGAGNAPRWNFHKYLLDGDGKLVEAFGTGVEPTAPRVVAKIERLLPAG